MKKTLRVLLWVFVIVFSITAVLSIARLAVRASIKKAHRITLASGIDEEVVVNIGGIKQYLYIRGQDLTNPLMVVVHGGPGSPMTPLLYTYQGGLENEYTIINWDQRNTGKTYYLNDSSAVYDTLTIERMVEDLRELVCYLTDRFEQEKVVVLGHSWGSVVGTLFAKQHPELVTAYVGVGQVVNPIDGDKLAIETAKQAARLAENTKDLSVFESLHGHLLNSPDFSLKSFIASRKLVKKYLSPLPDRTLLQLVLSPYYSLHESMFFLKDSFELQKPLLHWLTNEFDVRELGSDYSVPVYYILGDLDWVTPTVMAKEYFDTINAPDKELIIIANAGHMTMIDNTADFCEAVLTVLSKEVQALDSDERWAPERLDDIISYNPWKK